jgi:predicted DsbA family dithiol-disulfide isomerase
MNSNSVKNQVEYERNQAAALGITGTPGFMVGGEKTVGWASYDYIARLVTQAKKNNGQCLIDGIPC